MQMKALLGSGGLICSIHIGIQYAHGTYSLQESGLGIKIFRTDGRVLYQDDKATYCMFVNGLWKVSYGYSNDANQTFIYINLDGEVVEAPDELTPSTPVPSSAP